MGEYGQWILLGGLVLIFIVMIMFQMRRRKRVMAEQESLLDRLRPGMRIKTVAGTIGRIRELRDEGGGLRTILIETGHGSQMSFMLIDFQAVLAVMDDPMVTPSVITPSSDVAPMTLQTGAAEADCTFTQMKAEARGEDFDAKEFVEKSNKSRKRK